MSRLDEATACLRHHLGILAPRVAMVLGSGLGEVAARIDAQVSVPYESIPGFPRTAVEGHGRQVVLGHLGEVAVVCLQGRHHLYEGGDAESVTLPIRCMRRLGCDSLLLTNAAGSLHEGLPAHSLMAISDHINWSGRNPLVGPNDDAYGPRFPDMTAAWDADLRRAMLAAAGTVDVALAEGVYVMALGPSFETPAEVRALARIGGDAVGMSTVPECIVARHCGLRVAGLSMITNAGAGLGRGEPLDHAETLAAGNVLADDVARLIEAWLPAAVAPR